MLCRSGPAFFLNMSSQRALCHIICRNVVKSLKVTIDLPQLDAFQSRSEKFIVCVARPAQVALNEPVLWEEVPKIGGGNLEVKYAAIF